MNWNEYQKKWRKKNRDKWNAYQRKYRATHRAETDKRYYEKHPYAKLLRGVISRCANKNYKSRGITNKLTICDVKYLWDRDKGHQLNNPSIDRKNGTKGYTRRNCRVIELTDNLLRKGKVRNSKFIRLYGKTLKEIATAKNISIHAVLKLHNKGGFVNGCKYL